MENAGVVCGGRKQRKNDCMVYSRMQKIIGFNRFLQCIYIIRNEEFVQWTHFEHLHRYFCCHYKRNAYYNVHLQHPRYLFSYVRSEGVWSGPIKDIDGSPSTNRNRFVNLTEHDVTILILHHDRKCAIHSLCWHMDADKQMDGRNGGIYWAHPPCDRQQQHHMKPKCPMWWSVYAVCSQWRW